MKPETTGLRLRVLLMMRLETTRASRETMQQASLRQDYGQYKKYSKRMEAVWGFILELYPLIPPILLLEFKGITKMVSPLEKAMHRVGPEIRQYHTRTGNGRKSNSMIFGYSYLTIRKAPRREIGPAYLPRL